MQYGHFDNEKNEYVIDRVDLPTSWTNYLGVEDMAAVVNHTAGGYCFYKTPEYHRISRFRGNSVPMDRPGFYIYLRDDDKKDYWSASWQPVGKSLREAKYTTRHGLSYTVYECEYDGIKSEQRLCIPRGENVLIWDVKVKNQGSAPRNLSIFSYMEFSFHHIMIDNQNYQMSLYCAGSSYEDGIIEEDLFYEEEGYQYLSASFEPDGFDTLREDFIGTYNSETNPDSVEKGQCKNNTELGNNHCGTLMKKFILEPGEEKRFTFFLGEGRRPEGRRIREKYAKAGELETAYADLEAFWKNKQDKLVIDTPNQGMNTLINIWNLYQSEINVMFSRFASFIEVGGRVGLGYRDTAQDAMTIPHSNPEKCRSRIIELLRGLTTSGYGLHLFQPEWFEPKDDKKPFKSPTVIPEADAKSVIHGIKDACSDDALWLIPSIVEYIKETGDLAFADLQLTYADTYMLSGEAGNYGLKESVYEHMKRILNFSGTQVGQSGVCKGLRADWNDCLNLGGGESALVSCLHYWALTNFVELAEYLGRKEDADTYQKMADEVQTIINTVLWDNEWFLRGFTKNGRKIGCHEDKEGRVHLESNAWAILSGAAEEDKAQKALESIDKYLYTDWGLMLNYPSYTVSDDDVGFVTRVYPGLKENGSIFSHPNPWAQAAATKLGRGDIAMKFYNALCPYNQNDRIEIRKSEPYSYCQFIAGPDHNKHGRASHPFMTGSGGWSYFTATRFILGIRPEFDSLTIDPCVPSDWKNFNVQREFRGCTYDITVENPKGVMKGVKEISVDDKMVDKVKVFKSGETHKVRVVMG
ncbi:MAG: N,N'-diacetylchitobiose phosphorylase [Pseudobutyrivibrio sp.]|nr:N,N'-diacetylchitobiose phosphorylase [Pseudobutyrivibrio sp.]MCF0185323.1 N,N'-diacetylchitobiose phosphorylase [Bacteroidaceae bacterium]